MKLHFPHIGGQSILSSDFCRHRKVVDFLVLLKIIKELILVGLIIDISKPRDRERGSLGLLELVMLQRQLNQPRVTFNHFEEHIVAII